MYNGNVNLWKSSCIIILFHRRQTVNKQTRNARTGSAGLDRSIITRYLVRLDEQFCRRWTLPRTRLLPEDGVGTHERNTCIGFQRRQMMAVRWQMSFLNTDVCVHVRILQAADMMTHLSVVGPLSASFSDRQSTLVVIAAAAAVAGCLLMTADTSCKQRTCTAPVLSIWVQINTRSSAVAVIADRTAYDVRYTGRLSNRFRLHVTNAGTHDPIQRVEFMDAPKLLKRDHWAWQTQVQYFHEVSE